jgi:hypothetical protein
MAEAGLSLGSYMYTTQIRQYSVGNVLKTYAEYYEGDGKQEVPLVYARTERSFDGPLREATHAERLSEIQVVCARIAQNLDVALF